MSKIFVLFDTETTGLLAHPQSDLSLQPHMVEFAAIKTDGENILDQITLLCNPQIKIPYETSKVHGIYDDDVDGEPTFQFLIKPISKFFENGDVAAAHNLYFDKHILQYELARLKLSLDAINFPEKSFCSVEQLAPMFGYRPKLKDLYQNFIGDEEQTHRALSDVLMMHEVCKKLKVYDAFK